MGMEKFATIDEVKQNLDQLNSSMDSTSDLGVKIKLFSDFLKRLDIENTTGIEKFANIFRNSLKSRIQNFASKGHCMYEAYQFHFDEELDFDCKFRYNIDGDVMSNCYM